MTYPSAAAAAPFELDITGLGGLGDGVGRMTDGQVVFVAGALPGDRIQVQVLGKRQGVLRGQLLAVRTPSVDRVQPACSAFGQCGGCDLQHLSDAARLRHHQQQLQRVVGAQVAVTAVAVQAAGHRRRARLHLRQVQGQLVAGMLTARSDRVAETPHCPALDPALEGVRQRAVAALQDFLYLGELALVLGAQGVVAVLSGKVRSAPPTARELAARLGLAGLRYHLGQHQDQCGESEAVLPEMDPPWAVRTQADGFCQASEQANRALRTAVATAIGAAGDLDKAAEFYAGSGNFTDLLLRGGAQVVAFEQDEAACAQLARAARQANWSDRLRIIQGDVAAQLSAAAGATLWLLDPGRPGAADLCGAAGRLAPRDIVYVSCAFDTLGRDARTLAGHGYRPVAATAIDAFAWTVHAEAVVRFARA